MNLPESTHLPDPYTHMYIVYASVLKADQLTLSSVFLMTLSLV